MIAINETCKRKKKTPATINQKQQNLLRQVWQLRPMCCLEKATDSHIISPQHLCSLLSYQGCCVDWGCSSTETICVVDSKTCRVHSLDQPVNQTRFQVLLHKFMKCTIQIGIAISLADIQFYSYFNSNFMPVAIAVTKKNFNCSSAQSIFSQTPFLSNSSQVKRDFG